MNDVRNNFLIDATHLGFFLLTESIRLDVAIAIGICSALKPSTSSVTPAHASPSNTVHAETLADPYKGKTPLPRVPNY